MSAFPEDTDPGWRRRLRSRILRWYDQNGRQLPWRESADPYRIWISEIMLQQTTVAAVVPYFERFTSRFPNVQSLAAAEQSEVLRLWEGLGYYSRARNLHKSAQVIVDEMAGDFPQTKDELAALPGIGPYTAAAIASFAFNQRAGVVEANTLRLYSRLIELDVDPRGSAGQKLLWKFADWIIAAKRPGDFNQAVMDLGAQVCTPTDPNCPYCPLMASCKAYEAGRQDEIPLEKKKPEITDVVEVSIAVRKGNRYLLRQRTESERWAGLWDFVRFEITDDDAAQLQPAPTAKAANAGQKSLFSDSKALLPPAISELASQLTGLSLSGYESIVEIKHAVTRYRIRLMCLLCDVEGGRINRSTGYHWYSKDDLQELPLSRTGRQFAEKLAISQ